ncbi:MAG: hypothetical protein H6814_05520 [Phycisphaeraceae bacterium]|nr:hypothetical protein [Phycisphaeraceae bacterium]
MSDWLNPDPAGDPEQQQPAEESAALNPEDFGKLSAVDAGMATTKPRSRAPEPAATATSEPAAGPTKDESQAVTSLIHAIESRLEEVRRLGEDMNHRESSMTERVVDLDRKSAELSAKMAAIDAERAQLAARESSLRDKSDAIERREGELRRRMEEAEARLASIESREHALADQDAALHSRAQELETEATSVRDRDRSFSSREQQIRDRSREIEEAEAEAARLREELEAERQKLREMAQKLKQEHAALTEMKSAQLESNDRSLEDRERELAQLRASLEMERDRIEDQWRDYQTQKQNMLDGGAPALTSFEQQQQFEDRERELDEARTTVNSELERIEEQANALQTERESVKRARSVVEVDRDRGAAMAAIGAAMDQTLEECRIRRERLRGVREALRVREGKLAKAREIIRGKHKECERILAMRDRITKEQEEIEAQRAAIERKADRSRVAGVLMKLVIAVAILGGLSWAVADRIAPTTDLVRATLTAQPHGGASASQEAIEEWTRLCASLAQDPRLIEETADRLKRRGVEEFGSPGPLGAYFKDSLSVDSQRPGELNVALQGPGGGATKRILETYLAAFVAIANDATAQFADQASTVVSANASADSPPLTDDRLKYAGAMWGGATLLLLIIGWALWTRLAASTRKTDDAGTVAFGVG